MDENYAPLPAILVEMHDITSKGFEKKRLRFIINRFHMNEH